MSDSLAAELVVLASTTEMSEFTRFRFFDIAARVRRIELALSELASDAQESAELAEAAARDKKVVFVNFRGEV